MNAGREAIQKALSEALRNGNLRDLEEFLTSQIEALPQLPNTEEFAEIRRRFERQFMDRSKRLMQARSLLEHPEMNGSLADYLALLVRVGGCDEDTIATESGIGKTDFGRIMNDIRSVVDLPIGVFVKLGNFLGLSIHQMLGLLEKSMRLVALRKLQVAGMARYKDVGVADGKARSLRKAQDELLLKASSRRRFEIEHTDPAFEELIMSRLAEFKEAYGRGEQQ